MGHLTRANAFRYTLGYDKESFFVITSSSFACKIIDQRQLIIVDSSLGNEPVALCKRIEKTIKDFEITIFFIDSFPAGILGELVHLGKLNCEIIYIARILNWQNYKSINALDKIKFNRTYILEHLPENQLNFIYKVSVNIEYLEIKYPPNENAKEYLNLLADTSKPFWLIVHSDIKEIDLLVNYANEMAEMENLKPNMLVISDYESTKNETGNRLMNYYPASDFFNEADRIFTACGFNAMQQCKNFREKHFFIPFERKFDDQFLRAINRKQNRD
ncbi:MAG: hypothetical protein U0W24_24730 [Bacteroidales bacterium]